MKIGYARSVRVKIKVIINKIYKRLFAAKMQREADQKREQEKWQKERDAIGYKMFLAACEERKDDQGFYADGDSFDWTVRTDEYWWCKSLWESGQMPYIAKYTRGIFTYAVNDDDTLTCIGLSEVVEDRRKRLLEYYGVWS